MLSGLSVEITGYYCALEQRMSMYWIYDMPSWLFGFLAVAVTVLVGLVGLYATRKWVRKLHGVDHSHNDIVGFYLAGVSVFYGVTLGLVAIGTWTTYSDVEAKVDKEATAIGALYRDVGSYPEPTRTALQDILREYARQVIDVGWPQQRKGIVPTGASAILDKFEKQFFEFEPTTEAQRIADAEAYGQFNVLVASRRARLDSVTSGLPTPLWIMVLLGAFISIAITWFFDTASPAMHVWMTGLFSALLGLIIFLVATLDNPYRGDVSVSPEPLERVYDQLMK
jgi:Protein of unknown function (DUF4239)